MFLLSILACTVVPHPTVPTQRPTAQPEMATLLTPGPIVLESVVSARWAVPLSGLLDLDDPAAAELEDVQTPIVLPVQVLTHPTEGVFIVDTGVSDAMARGEAGPTRGLVKGLVSDIEPVHSLGSILSKQTAPLAGVLLTHAHLDHILGLPDVPVGTPVYIGPDEFTPRSMQNLVTRGTTGAAFEGHTVLELRFEDAPSIEGLAAVDLIGDGTLYALHSPGHTVGSLAYLARTTEGPVLMTGDTSHTWFGWDHGVPPGTYTADGEANRASLNALRALAERGDVRVIIGHEVK